MPIDRSCWDESIHAFTSLCVGTILFSIYQLNVPFLTRVAIWTCVTHDPCIFGSRSPYVLSCGRLTHEVDRTRKKTVLIINDEWTEGFSFISYSYFYKRFLWTITYSHTQIIPHRLACSCYFRTCIHVCVCVFLRRAHAYKAEKHTRSTQHVRHASQSASTLTDVRHMYTSVTRCYCLCTSRETKENVRSMRMYTTPYIQKVICSCVHMSSFILRRLNVCVRWNFSGPTKPMDGWSCHWSCHGSYGAIFSKKPTTNWRAAWYRDVCRHRMSR